MAILSIATGMDTVAKPQATRPREMTWAETTVVTTSAYMIYVAIAYAITAKTGMLGLGNVFSLIGLVAWSPIHVTIRDISWLVYVIRCRRTGWSAYDQEKGVPRCQAVR